MRYALVNLIFLLCAGFTAAAHAAESASPRWQPDAMIVQFAGNIGVLAAGIEKQKKESDWYGSLLLGYAPASVVGVDVYAAAAKLNYRLPWSFGDADNRFTPYAGFMVSYYFGDEYDSERYTPSDYYPYPANQWHLTPYLGLRLSAPSSATPEIALYAEVGIHDAYFGYWYYNRDYHHLRDVINIAIGLSVPFD